MNIRHFLYLFLISFILAQLHVWALEPTPIRISVSGKDKCFCEKKATTIGLDLGLWAADACVVVGVQFAPVSSVGSVYGFQVGLLGALSSNVYGIQFGGLATYNEPSGRRSYGIQIAGIVNNPPVSGIGSITGIQLAGLLNAAGEFSGAQISLINFSAVAKGLQIGLLNIQQDADADRGSGPLMQLGAYNRANMISGVQAGIMNYQYEAGPEIKVTGIQFGIYNYAADITGLQFGVVNRAVKLKGLQVGLINMVSKQHRKINLPFTPILNVSW